MKSARAILLARVLKRIGTVSGCCAGLCIFVSVQGYPHALPFGMLGVGIAFVCFSIRGWIALWLLRPASWEKRELKRKVEAGEELLAVSEYEVAHPAVQRRLKLPLGRLWNLFSSLWLGHRLVFYLAGKVIL